MLRAAGIEPILAKGVFACDEAKPVGWHDHVNIAAHRADGAIAVFHFERFRKLDLEPNRFAVAAAKMCFERAHRRRYPTQTGGRRSAQGAARSNCPAS